ncbi:MAG: helix-turn-helix domain-containing protein [Eudoraea sp.]|nr:helix-turn-helix domain-containing protein [Eudoraea sp.]
MNITAIFNFLLIAGAVQGFIFNIATFLSRRKIERPVLFLNLFVFVLSMNNLQSWLIDKGFVASDFFMSQFIIPWYVLIVPFFYAFLLYYLGIEKKKWPFLQLTAAIFIMEMVVRSIVIILIQKEVLNPQHIGLYNAIEDAVTLIYALFLYFKALRILYNYESLYRPILEYDSLNWIKLFLKLGGVVILLWMIAVLLNLFSSTIKAPYSYYPLRLGSSILIYWVGYQAFFQYVILKDRIVLRGKIRKRGYTANATKTIKKDLPNSVRDEETFLKVDRYIKDNQRYLDPYLSLEKLADELSLGTSSLSRLINTYSRYNFSDYINSLRIAEAKKFLKSSEFSSYTMVAIGLECGFNSRSTFYAAFKKLTGSTPTQYRN